MSQEAATVRNDLWAESVGIPEYVCHKRVRASKICAFENVSRLMLEDCEHGFVVSHDWLLKHSPEVGGYLVFYADGYTSYSPAKAFEEGYQPGAVVTSAPVSASAK